MKKLTYKNLEYCEYDVIRIYYGGDPGKGHLYAPSDMKFYKTWDAENKFELDGHAYSQKNWVGVTTYSKEKEQISHNMHWNICGKKDDYPVINIIGVNVHNIGNKYLVWELKDIDIDVNEKDFPICNDIPKFDDPVYLMRSAKTEELDILQTLLESRNIEDIDFDREVNKPYLYIKVHGLSKRGDALDCSTVMVRPWCYYVNEEVNEIERTTIDFIKCTLGGDHINNTCMSSKEEYDTMFQKILNNIV